MAIRRRLLKRSISAWQVRLHSFLLRLLSILSKDQLSVNFSHRKLEYFVSLKECVLRTSLLCREHIHLSGQTFSILEMQKGLNELLDPRKPIPVPEGGVVVPFAPVVSED